MSDDTSAFERGAAKIREVYAGNVVDLPEGTMAFNDVMMKSLFAEVWDRDVLSIDARRLLIMGVIAARGGTNAPCDRHMGKRKWQFSHLVTEYF